MTQNSKTRVYLLQPIFDDQRYARFSAKRSKGYRPGSEYLVDDFVDGDSTTTKWTASSIADIWRPLAVESAPVMNNDYPCVDGRIPAFSRRAVDVLRDILEVNGELLPLRTKVGEYFCYNIQTVADALDMARSEVVMIHPVEVPFSIDRYEFIEKRIASLLIFRIPEAPFEVFVTEAFKLRAEAANLRGFNFCLVWPLPKNVTWLMLKRQNRHARERAGLPVGETIKGQSVIIRLMPEDEKFTANERARVRTLMDDLERDLLKSKSARPYGTLEGHEYVKGEVRLFFSCPNAERLYKKLKPLLIRSGWNSKRILIVKRTGAYHDSIAAEVTISLSDGDVSGRPKGRNG